MKVLFVSHCTPMAGANRSMLQLIIELRESYGIEPYVLLPEYHGQNKTLRDYLLDNDIPYKETKITFFKKKDSSAYSRRDTIVSYGRINSLAREFLPYKFDIIHSNSSVIDFGAYLSRKLGVKHVWHLRDFGDLDYSLHSVFGKLYECLTYRNAESFIAISDGIKRHFCKTINPSKITVIYNGIKSNVNVPLSSHRNSKVQFLCAGVYLDAKNQLEILQAADVLVNEFQVTNFHVTTVGIGVESQYAHQLKQYAKDHSIDQYVSILGEINGIAELASTMDVGIMTSRNEAFGRVTVEYMLQNLAVIANDNGANPEIVEHGKSGLIYPHDDYRALADLMRQLIQDRSMIVSLAIGGRQRANDRFLSVYNSKAIFELYEKIIRNRKFSPNSLINIVCRLIIFYYDICSFFAIKLYALRVRVYEYFNKNVYRHLLHINNNFE